MAKKKRSKQQAKRGAAPASQGPALSPEEQSARREQQKREWAAQKRAQVKGGRSAAPFVWTGIGLASVAGVVVAAILLFAGGGGGSSSGPTATATRDPRLGSGAVAKTVQIDANDQGQNVNPTFSVTSITARAGEIVEIDVKNIGSVHHNLNFAGLDAEYGSPDDWTTNPQSIAPGETGKVLVKFDTPGTYAFHCDFHPDSAQKGTLVVS